MADPDPGGTGIKRFEMKEKNAAESLRIRHKKLKRNVV
jgi:hypothetical protein